MCRIELRINSLANVILFRIIIIESGLSSGETLSHRRRETDCACRFESNTPYISVRRPLKEFIAICNSLRRYKSTDKWTLTKIAPLRRERRHIFLSCARHDVAKFLWCNNIWNILHIARVNSEEQTLPYFCDARLPRCAIDFQDLKLITAWKSKRTRYRHNRRSLSSDGEGGYIINATRLAIAFEPEIASKRSYFKVPSSKDQPARIVLNRR